MHHQNKESPTEKSFEQWVRDALSVIYHRQENEMADIAKLTASVDALKAAEAALEGRLQNTVPDGVVADVDAVTAKLNALDPATTPVPAPPANPT